MGTGSCTMGVDSCVGADTGSLDVWTCHCESGAWPCSKTKAPGARRRTTRQYRMAAERSFARLPPMRVQRAAPTVNRRPERSAVLQGFPAMSMARSTRPSPQFAAARASGRSRKRPPLGSMLAVTDIPYRKPRRDQPPTARASSTHTGDTNSRSRWARFARTVANVARGLAFPVAAALACLACTQSVAPWAVAPAAAPTPAVTATPATEAEDLFVPTACRVDSDCACGTDRKTGACRVGRIDRVDPTQPCGGDVCEGIEGRHIIACVSGRCLSVLPKTPPSR
jgi:hypothetical protein